MDMMVLLERSTEIEGFGGNNGVYSAYFVANFPTGLEQVVGHRVGRVCSVILFYFHFYSIFSALNHKNTNNSQFLPFLYAENKNCAGWRMPWTMDSRGESCRIRLPDATEWPSALPQPSCVRKTAIFARIVATECHPAPPASFYGRIHLLPCLMDLVDSGNLFNYKSLKPIGDYFSGH
jgi:hypothetical protein